MEKIYTPSSFAVSDLFRVFHGFFTKQVSISLSPEHPVNVQDTDVPPREEHLVNLCWITRNTWQRGAQTSALCSSAACPKGRM